MNIPARQIYSLRVLILSLLLLSTLAFAQQPAVKPQTNKATDKTKQIVADGHALDNPDILRQMNSALEDLAARVSPAVGADSDFWIRASER